MKLRFDYIKPLRSCLMASGKRALFLTIRRILRSCFDLADVIVGVSQAGRGHKTKTAASCPRHNRRASSLEMFYLTDNFRHHAAEAVVRPLQEWATRRRFRARAGCGVLSMLAMAVRPITGCLC